MGNWFALEKLAAETAVGLIEKAVEAPKAAAAPAGGNAATNEPGMPHSSLGRKQTPIATGVLGYFPDAIAEVAKVSFIGNEKHNPGEPLHWARGKSADQTDAALRHIMDYVTGSRRDVDGSHVLAQAAWRVLAELQLAIEKEKASK